MSLLQHFAFATRALRKQRGLAISVVATLGIAVAATSVVAVVVDQALRRPLPFRDPSQLLILWEKSRGGDFRLASYPAFLDWQRAAPKAFAGLGYARGNLDVLSTREGPVRATTAFVTPGFLQTLGATPTLGRLFVPDEEAAGRGDVAVLTERFWRFQFGGDPAIVGRSITLSGRAVTVVGVVPTPMVYPLWADLWRPISAIVDTDPALASRHHHTDSRVLARLRDGVGPATAMAEIATIQQSLARANADQGADWTSADFKPLTWEFIGNSSAALTALAGAVALTLLVACVNVATLFLLRAFAREREFAIRSALGAERGRLLRLAAVECGALGACGTALATPLSWWGLALVRTAAPEAIPRTSELAFDGRVVGLVLVLGTLGTIIAASAALARALHGGSIESLRAGWQPTSGGRAGGRWRAALASLQLALALTLIAGTGLLLESFRHLREVDLGFDPRHLASMWIAPPKAKYASPEQTAALYTRLQDAVAAIPGVQDVAIVNHIPLSGGWSPTKIFIPGRTPATDGSDAALYKTVSANYLRVMKGRLLRGRWFTDADIRGAGDGIVVNEEVAKRYWPNADPVGKPITIFRSAQGRPGFGDPEPSVVLGVIASMHHLSIADDPIAEVYVPYTRDVWLGAALLIRARGESRALEIPLRRAMREVEPDLPVLGSPQWRAFEPLDANIARMLGPRRTVLGVVIAFAVAALVLAAIGVYGVTAFGVAQRMREFGIRMALGATARDVVALVLRQSAALATIGTVAGIAGGFAITRLLRASLNSLLYRTSPFAAVPLAASTAILVVIAVVAAFRPARRASRADPLIALRSE